jgi:diguanylate cyclase (GGDEF)-like protein/PAS domain S-box-containing protein
MIARSLKTVLFIESNVREVDDIRKMLKSQGSYTLEMTFVDCMARAEIYLAEHAVDVVLLDLRLSDAQGLEAVRRIQAATPARTAIVLLATRNDEMVATRAVEEGVQDYLLKEQIKAYELLRTLRNAMALKVAEDHLFIENERAQVILDSIGDAVICADIAGKITSINPTAELLTGWSVRDAVGRPMAEVFRIVDAVTRETVPNPMGKVVRQNRSENCSLNCILIRRDGQECFIEDSAGPIHDRGGEVIGSVITFRDVSEAWKLAENAIRTSQHDPLTALPNRRLLIDRFAQAIAQASRRMGHIGVLFLDLDGFKYINDSLGHPTGDKLLQSVAKRLTDCVRIPDTVSRHGGDEFIVLLPEVELAEDVALAAGRILQAISGPHVIDHHTLHISASVGVSIYPEDGQDAETLIRNADTAMYLAKEAGRSRYIFFRPEMNLRAAERQSIEKALQFALERKEFALQYQPIVSLRTGAITGVEALVRWRHPKLGTLPAARFIRIAEDCGLASPIGNWVLREACLQARHWREAGLPPFTIAINSFAVQLHNVDFVDDLINILSETGIEPEALELELTESALMRHPDFTVPQMQNLRDSRVRFAVDDFGTGRTSLSYLQMMPLDALKIDRSLVFQIGVSGYDPIIVKTIISMARSLNLKVIAEGVETDDHLVFLKDQGCDEAQGFYFSPPVPPEDIVGLSRKPQYRFNCDHSQQ